MNERHSVLRTRLLLCLLLAAACAAVIVGVLHFIPERRYPAQPDGETVVINEVVTKNLLGVQDAHGHYCDWVELYNYGTADLDLGGFGFSDDADEPFRYTFPQGVVLPADSYLIVTACIEAQPNDALCMPFGFAEGETLLLTDPQSRTLDSVALPAKTEYGMSVGRDKNDSMIFVSLATPTPGEFNHSVAVQTLFQTSDALCAPAFSVEGGYFDDAFDLELTSEEGTQIYYTLDGSEPDENAALYTLPIRIDRRDGEPNRYASILTAASYYRFLLRPNETPVYKGTVVRARTFRDGVFSAESTTNTYFIDPDYSLPVVSLTSSPVDLFDEDDGLYMPGLDVKLWRKYNSGTSSGEAPIDMLLSDRTIRAHLEMFETDGTRVLNDNVGIGINGKFSSTDRCKSLFVSTGKKYGSSGSFRYDLFRGQATDADSEPITQFKDLILRNSGGDFYSTMLRDAFLQSLISPVFDVTQAYRPCILFIDGEYWGIHNIRERYSESYFENHFHVDRKSLCVLKYFGEDPEITVGSERDKQEYLELGAYASQHDLSVPEHYAYVAQRVDVDNLARYFAVQMYYNNGDFLGNNVRVWRADDRSSPYGDGKWRFALFDLDLAMLAEPILDLPTRLTETGKQTYTYTILFRELMRNDAFRSMFVGLMNEWLDTVFEPNAACAKLDAMVDVIRPEMREHCARWTMERSWIGKLYERFGGDSVRDSYAVWENAVEDLRSVVKARPQQMRDWLRETYGETDKPQ